MSLNKYNTNTGEGLKRSVDNIFRKINVEKILPEDISEEAKNSNIFGINRYISIDNGASIANPLHASIVSGICPTFVLEPCTVTRIFILNEGSGHGTHNTSDRFNYYVHSKIANKPIHSQPFFNTFSKPITASGMVVIDGPFVVQPEYGDILRLRFVPVGGASTIAGIRFMVVEYNRR